MTRIIRHPDRAALAAAVVDDVADSIAAGTLRGYARIALPGGSTPAAILPRLFARDDLDWAKVGLTVGDERQVSWISPLSNFGQVRRLAAGTPAAAAIFVKLEDLAVTGFDLVWVGVGDDGHVLSWFPGPDLDAALNGPPGVVEVMPDPLPTAAPYPRLTLSRASVATARSVILVATGADKLAVIERPDGLPVGALFEAVPFTRVHWAP